MTKFQAGTIHTRQVMDYQGRAIRKAIRPLFADLFTFLIIQYSWNILISDIIIIIL